MCQTRRIRGVVTKRYESNDKSDVVNVRSRVNFNNSVNVYACRFSNGAKWNLSGLLALGTEDGRVHLVDREGGTPHAVSNALDHTHSGAIHDIQWSQNDTFIASASGDGVASIHDSQTSKLTTTLVGHGGAIKCVGWSTSSPGIVYTGGRDGEILLWDVRISSSTRVVNCLTEKFPKSSKCSGGRNSAYINRCITAIVQRTNGQGELISASANDGKLRKWDIRLGSGNSGHIEITKGDPTITSGSKRPRGVTSIVRGVAQSRGMIFGLAFNSQVHVYNEADLSVRQRDYGSNGSSKAMRCMSYWIKMSINRNGQQVISGGQDGTAFIWNTSRASDTDNRRILERSVPVPTALQGHEGEVGAVDIGGDGTIVTCGDDEIVRFWREVAIEEDE